MYIYIYTVYITYSSPYFDHKVAYIQQKQTNAKAKQIKIHRTPQVALQKHLCIIERKAGLNEVKAVKRTYCTSRRASSKVLRS